MRRVPTEDEITSRLRRDGYEIRPWAVTYINQGTQRQLRAELRWRAHPEEAQSPAFLQGLVHYAGVLQLEWKP
jgi:hypothetical protein